MLLEMELFPCMPFVSHTAGWEMRIVEMLEACPENHRAMPLASDLSPLNVYTLRTGAGIGQLSQRAAAPPTCLPGVLALSVPHLCSPWSQRLFFALLVSPPGGLSMWPQIEGDGEVNSVL